MEKDKNRNKHESYAMLSFDRCASSADKYLFGSSIPHNNYISMTISRGELTREHGQSWFFSRKRLIEVEMSHTQFTEAITSMNMGGVPVTLRHLGNKRMAPCPFKDTRAKLEHEFNETIQTAMRATKEAIKQAESLIKQKKPLKKDEKKEFLRLLNSIDMNIGSNAAFMFAQFQRQTDQTVKEAKGEIEAFRSNLINKLGIKKLREKMIDVENVNLLAENKDH